MRRALDYRWSLAAAALAVLSGAAEWLGLFDISDYFSLLHAYLEPYGVDDLLLAGMLLLPALIIDMHLIRRREREQHARERERLDTLHATMHTVQDVVNNALTGMQQLRMEAQSCQSVQPDTLATFDRIVEDTASRLRVLGNLDTVRERRTSSGVSFIEYPQPRDGGKEKG